MLNVTWEGRDPNIGVTALPLEQYGTRPARKRPGPRRGGHGFNGGRFKQLTTFSLHPIV
jgi:hypothetical protein